MAEEKNTDKLKKELMTQFNKDFPDSPLEQMNESNLAKIPGWISTNNYALNWAISKDMNKGLPMGRVVLLTGDPSSGKCVHEDTMVKLLNQNEKPGVEYLSEYSYGETSNDSDHLMFDCIEFEYNDMTFVVPERCQIYTYNRGFVFAEQLSEDDEVFIVIQ